MMYRLFSFIGRFFKKKEEIKFHFDPHARTIPEAFGLDPDQYKDIISDLRDFLILGDRLAALEYFLKSKLFEKYNLNLDDPNHAAILGYAFSTAVVLNKDAETKKVAKQVLDLFKPATFRSPNDLVA